MNIDKSYGSPYDRGSADSYYGRKPEPHWYKNGHEIRVEEKDMTKDQIADYYDGYVDNSEDGDHKDYGNFIARPWPCNRIERE